MESKTSSTHSGELLDEIRKELACLQEIRTLQETDRKALMPLALVNGPLHQPVNPMNFKIGEWTETPWEGVTCYGITLTDQMVKVMCEVQKPIRMDKQEHGPWEERLIMDEGELFEHSSGNLYKPGDGVYLQPAGVVHEPEFKTPSVCVITWTRTDRAVCAT